MPIDITCPTVPDGATVYKITNRRMNSNGAVRSAVAAGAAAGTVGAAATGMGNGNGFSVHVKVFATDPQLGVGGMAGDYDLPGVGATQATYDGTRWCANNVAAPAIPSGGVLYIAVWLMNDNTVPSTVGDRNKTSFSASDTAGIGCPGCGSGSGPMGVAAGGGTTAGAVALSMAPLMWGLLVSGFEAAKGVLNGPFALDLKHVVGGYCVWDNGGDGAATPRVELRCESPLVTTWRLTLTHGATVETYTRPAAEWNPLTPNAVVRAGRTDKGVPDQLILTPS